MLDLCLITDKPANGPLLLVPDIIPFTAALIGPSPNSRWNQEEAPAFQRQGTE